MLLEAIGAERYSIVQVEDVTAARRAEQALAAAEHRFRATFDRAPIGMTLHALDGTRPVDGFGYPDGLRGSGIPLEARIVSVGAVFDALTSDRAYRKAYSAESAVAVMRTERARQFDAGVLDAFLEILPAMRYMWHDASANRQAVA